VKVRIKSEYLFQLRSLNHRRQL